MYLMNCALLLPKAPWKDRSISKASHNARSLCTLNKIVSLYLYISTLLSTTNYIGYTIIFLMSKVVS